MEGQVHSVGNCAMQVASNWHRFHIIPFTYGLKCTIFKPEITQIHVNSYHNPKTLNSPPFDSRKT